MAMAEIEVFGGGVFGLSVAYALLKRGARVRLIEKRAIGAGSSGGVVGALAPHTPDNWNDKKQFQLESLLAAESYWAEVDRLSGLSSGYGRIGRLSTIGTHRGLVLAREREKSAKEFWGDNARWRVVHDSDFPGWAPIGAVGFLTHDTLSARLSPKGAALSLAEAIRALGGEIVEGQTEGKGADAVVLCTGYEGLEELSIELGTEVGNGVKGQGLSVACPIKGKPQLYANALHIIPHADGTVAIGSTSENQWSDPVSVDEQLDALHTRAVELCPVLRDAPIVRRWAGVRPRGHKRAPMLGRHPTRENVFIANGGFKIGFGVSVKVGEVMADLVLNGQAEIPDSFTVEANL